MSVMKKPLDNKRSREWPKVRKAFLKGKVCSVCGGSKKLEAHHIMPFHVDKSLETDPNNLLALCEGLKELNCHLVIGHLLNFRGYNPNVIADAAAWNKKILENKERIKNLKDGKNNNSENNNE